MHSLQYIELLPTRVISERNRLYPDASGAFQQDLTQCLTSKQVKKFLMEPHQCNKAAKTSPNLSN